MAGPRDVYIQPMTNIAIFDPFSGIAGDMTLGALLDLGLDPEWLKALPATLKLDGVSVRLERVKRGEIAGWKVDFNIPPQPHGRHLKHIKAIVDASPAPALVKERAMLVFEAVTTVEASIHGTTLEKVHLHELSQAAAAALGAALPTVAAAILAETGATAYNVLQNNGALAHQAVMHVHFHIIPKFDDGRGLGIGWNATPIDHAAGAALAGKVAARLRA